MTDELNEKMSPADAKAQSDEAIIATLEAEIARLRERALPESPEYGSLWFAGDDGFVPLSKAETKRIRIDRVLNPEAEREACAKVVESLWAYRTCQEVADAIRARTEETE